MNLRTQLRVPWHRPFLGGQKGLVEENDLRIPNMRGIMMARKKELMVIEANKYSSLDKNFLIKFHDMDLMFYFANAFNQDLSSWCVTNISDEPSGFSTNSPLIESNKPIWGTCSSFGLDNQNQLDILIYPNPTSNYIYINNNIELEALIQSRPMTWGCNYVVSLRDITFSLPDIIVKSL